MPPGHSRPRRWYRWPPWWDWRRRFWTRYFWGRHWKQHQDHQHPDWPGRYDGHDDERA